MIAATTANTMSPGLLKVRERAERDPEGVLLALAHLIDEEALQRAYRSLRNEAAVGVDGITKEQYGQDLEHNVRDLHARMKSMRYRHQPIRRVHIPKERGKTRPIGISCTEDKIVQAAVREMLEVIYEPVFRDVSYGFRPGRSAHDALRALNRMLLGGVEWILEADIESFFDSIDRTKLMEMLQARVADKSLLRLVGKCLHVGVLDGAEFYAPEDGTVQGSVLSPLLGNVYLHHVLDLWIEREVQPRLVGKATLIRYADDFIIGFEREDDAKRVTEVLPRRFERYGLKLHPDKTRLLPFGRPDNGQPGGKGPATFDFLGFTHYWRRSRAGRWMPSMKTRKARLRRAITAVADFCRRHRHRPVKEQHAALTRRIVGHRNYFGVNGNLRSIALLIRTTERAWHKWLCRRSQRAHLNWKRFQELLRDFPLPRPQIRVQIWTSP
ncbi:MULTISPECIES: group II intron reverse transcriptase/maturase [Sorangium]|uniref:Integron/retron-type RNA-directed DNA polymerase (Reverse transcriptase) n=1 Tax=Sorangium cellulosum (strain So ce56) TaxID=448385 RepID=A9ENQ0_SORC5|nr:group II intron reverse transcriptase/maturase [Sorangium cellulosum]CAN90886.1 probable reverse transcriptase/maturase family protein [Sorangium cellulosum So ce56]CAN95702.1 integron/retron-type RNA-directed DNA polymerase (Reverse transcriptase) [Sorangium cellulosum So ce56]CAN96486.1 integron/retron-type RNA-directed DNA polymerase (Reverse transcriptase) [Sorangium cellulosum So ce56]